MKNVSNFVEKFIKIPLDDSKTSCTFAPSNLKTKHNMKNKEQFALTCINDEPSVVSVKLFDTKDEARSQMAKDVAAEEKSWDEDYTITTSITEDYASMRIEENGFFYIWNIDKVKE